MINQSKDHQNFMQQALAQAKLAATLNEVPVGAVLVDKQNIIADGHNLCINNIDPTAHAEIIAIRNAAKVINNYRLVDLSLYVTVEPCIMCFGAIINARIKNLIFGAIDSKFGAINGSVNLTKYQFNHKINITSNILALDCQLVIQKFFQNKRK